MSNLIDFVFGLLAEVVGIALWTIAILYFEMSWTEVIVTAVGYATATGFAHAGHKIQSESALIVRIPIALVSLTTILILLIKY